MPQASIRFKVLEILHQSAISVAIHRNEAISGVLNSSSDSELTDEDNWTDVSSDEGDSSTELSPMSANSSLLSEALDTMLIDSGSLGSDATMSTMEEIDLQYRDILDSIQALEDEVTMARVLECLDEGMM
ncbi:hypothetical protein V8E55_010727 [Tylopilus felleus]